tara:strand:- start:159 stop:635 length:477 start_codon:yes stop_codon:yes gene_type:complete
MARKGGTTKELTDALLNDWEEQSETQLGELIHSVTKDLASEDVSPVKTGFFASSWQVSKTRMPPEDQAIKNPWKTIEKTKGAPYIAPRYKVPTKFKFNQSIFIGNRAEYTKRAIESRNSHIGAYLLNGSGTFKEGLRQKIDRIFTDKRPNINVLGLDV